MSSSFLLIRSGSALLLASLLTACVSSPPPRPFLAGSPPLSGQGDALFTTSPSVPSMKAPDPAVRRVQFRRQEWLPEQRTDRALVSGCVTLSQQGFRHQPARTWVYAGNGRYRPQALPPRPAASCWGELQQVFLAQARSASRYFTERSRYAHTYAPNPVALYDLTAAHWAYTCSRLAVDPAGLQHCFSPEALHRVAKAKARAARFLG